MNKRHPVPTSSKPSLFILRKTVLSLAITQVLWLGTAHANTITVNDSSDPATFPTTTNICTLRDAISAAQTNAIVDGCPAGSNSASDIINFTSSLSNTTITLSTGQLNIPADSGLTIDGGANNVIIDAAGNSRVIIVGSGATLTLDGLTLTGGSTPFVGGGILAGTGTISLINSTVSGNSAVSQGGGIFVIGSNLILKNSTLSGNSAAFQGGGILAAGGTTSLINSTVSGNTSNSGGGIFIYAAGTDHASITLTNSTVSGNTATKTGGGIYVYSNASVSLINSIVANSVGGVQDCNLYSGSTATADTHSIIQNDGCGTQAQKVDPMLGPLADNGGLTQTLLPQAGSPAINNGDQAVCTSNSITTDQRGYYRVDGACDIGSVEVGGLLGAGLQFATTTGSVNENGVSITVDVSRIGDTSNAVLVNYATQDGTAVSTPLSSADYTAVSGTLNFAVGETSKPITVPIVDQNLTSGNKTFSVVLSNPQASTGSVSLGTNSTDTITINDNDSKKGGGGGSTSLLSLLVMGLIWPLRRWRNRREI